jgi:hypothetical protein
MGTEFRGKVKQDIWTRPVCTDTSDSFRLRQRARRDFLLDRWEEDEPGADVASPDVLDEAFELGEPG